MTLDSKAPRRVAAPPSRPYRGLAHRDSPLACLRGTSSLGGLVKEASGSIGRSRPHAAIRAPGRGQQASANPAFTGRCTAPTNASRPVAAARHVPLRVTLLIQVKEEQQPPPRHAAARGHPAGWASAPAALPRTPAERPPITRRQNEHSTSRVSSPSRVLSVECCFADLVVLGVEGENSTDVRVRVDCGEVVLLGHWQPQG